MTKHIGPWQQVSSKIVYQNPWIQVREDEVIRPDGQLGMYGVVETKGDSVLIVALTPQQEVYLLQLYRYPTQMDSWEVSAGNSDGQDTLIAAKRGLLEETGLEAKEWHKVGRFQAMNGVMSEMADVFVAQDLAVTNNHQQAEEGIVAVKAVPLAEVLKMIANGTITDAHSIAALTFAKLWLDKQAA